MVRLARATPTDVAGIGMVIQDVWEQDILPDVGRAQIEDDHASLWVAKERGEVLGFASAFLTGNRAGHLRWEVDLVAVRSAHQGEGLGTKLIQRVCEDALGRGAGLARALVGVDNYPSQVAFHRAGFTSDHFVYRLLIWPPLARAPRGSCPDRVSLHPVDTLIYRGVWIEGLERAQPSAQRCAVTAARSLVAEQDRLNAGAVIPAGKEDLLPARLLDRSEMQGEYCWFVRPLTPAGMEHEHTTPSPCRS